MWLHHTTARERRALVAGFLGYGLDGFDFMIYTFVIPTLLAAWAMTNAEAGYIATAALVTSAAGGWAAGILADRFGRIRMLQWDGGVVCALHLLERLRPFLPGADVDPGAAGIRLRRRVGGRLRVGCRNHRGEHRGKATGLVQSSWAFGWAAAAIAYWVAYAWLPASAAWRVLFWIGIAPALLIAYIRRRVEESNQYLTSISGRGAGDPSRFLDIFRRPCSATALASILCCGMMGAYYSVTTWLPTYPQE